MTQKNSDGGSFENSGEFKKFKELRSTSNGQRPVITPRGLNLVDRKFLDSQIGLVVSSATYSPQDQFERALSWSTSR